MEVSQEFVIEERFLDSATRRAKLRRERRNRVAPLGMTEKKESRRSSMTMPRSVHSMGWATNIRKLSSRTSIVAKHGGAKEIGVSGAAAGTVLRIWRRGC